MTRLDKSRLIYFYWKYRKLESIMRSWNLLRFILDDEKPKPSESRGGGARRSSDEDARMIIQSLIWLRRVIMNYLPCTFTRNRRLVGHMSGYFSVTADDEHAQNTRITVRYDVTCMSVRRHSTTRLWTSLSPQTTHAHTDSQRVPPVANLHCAP